VEFARIGADATGDAGEWHGVDAMWAACIEWLRTWDELRVEPERFIDLGERVLVLARQTGRGKQSGLPVELEVGDLFTLRDGKIVRWELYVNRGEALRAVGLEE
jgi:ketosteroid isomerase-like protein